MSEYLNNTLTTNRTSPNGTATQLGRSTLHLAKCTEECLRFVWSCFSTEKVCGNTTGPPLMASSYTVITHAYSQYKRHVQHVPPALTQSRLLTAGCKKNHVNQNA
jgi:hypothetical protein